MSTTRSRLGARLAVTLASALTVGGLVAIAPAANADATVTSSTLKWGFKSSFRTYVGNQFGASVPAPVGERIVPTAPATFDPASPATATTVAEATRPYIFPGTTGSVVSATDISVPTTGGVTYNFPDHNFTVELSNLKAVVSGSTATLYADTKYHAEDGGGFEGGDVEETQVALATSSSLTVDVQDATATVAATNVTLTAAGAAAVPLYDAGTALDNFTVSTNQSDTPTVSVSQTDISPNGSTVVTVNGTFFDPAASIGTRPPLSGQPTGTYVVFGKFAPTWKPSAGAASSTRTAAPSGTGGQKWAVPAAGFNTVGGAAGGAVLLNADGSFTAKIRISKTQIDELAAAAPGNTNYGIYTYPASGGSAPSYETFTPITFSAAGTNVALNASTYTGTAGTAIPVTATVSNSGVAGTPTGTVKLIKVAGDDSETVLDTKTLTAGAATLEIPSSTAAGTGSLVVRYETDGTFPGADSTPAGYTVKVNSAVAFSSAAYSPVAGSTTPFTVTVTKPATIAAPTGNVVVTYTPQGGSATAVGTVTLTTGMNGVASFTLPALAKGATGTLQASYAGNTNYAAATATDASYTVAGNTPTVGLSNTHYAGPAGDPIDVGVTVAGVEGKATPTGTVALTYTPTDGSATTLTGVALVDGAATVQLPDTLAVGTGSLQVAYSGDSLYGTGSKSATYEIGKNAAAVSLDKANYPVVAGSTAAVGVTVAGVEGQPTPTGTVTLTYTPAGGTEQTLTAVNLTSGAATVTLPATLLGGSAGALTVVYSGDASYSNGSKGATYTVGKAASTVVLDKSAYTGTTGTSVPVVVTVNGPSGQPTPAGSVTLTYTPDGDLGTTLAAATLTNGSATVNLPAALVGSGAISVVYGGNDVYSNDDATATYAIAKAAATVSLDKAAYTAVVGSTVPVEVTVAGAAGTPTGSVVLTYTPTGGAAVALPAANLSAGKVTVDLPSTVGAGTGAISVAYSGSASYLTDTETATYTLTKKSTAITVAGPAGVAYRTAATYTATLTNGATGQVKITGAGVTYLRPIASGKATFVLPATLPAGARTLKFEYAGDASTNAAAAVNKAVTIAKGATTVTASVTKKWTAAKAGALTVVVKSVKGGPVPVGKVTVSLKKGSVTKSLTAKVLANGKVVFTLPKSAKGTWTVKVTYVGSTQHTAVTRSWTVAVPAR